MEIMGHRAVVKEVPCSLPLPSSPAPLQSAVILGFITLKSVKLGTIVAYILKNFIMDGDI